MSKLEEVICISILEDGGEPGAQLIEVGRPYEVIEAELAERFKETPFPYANSVDKTKHVEDIALRNYTEQFDSWALMGELRNVFCNIDVGAKLTIEVVKISGEEWAEAERRGRIEAGEEDAEEDEA